MDSAWPWLAIAGLGALHGLNPACGWPLAAACAWRGGGAAAALRALGPLAIGHLLSVALVAAAVAAGLGLPRHLLPGLAGALLLAVAALHWAGRRIGAAPAGRLALGLWSFIVSSAQGAGLMLVPALAPLCLRDAPGREITASGSLLLALAAVGVHMAAMLAAAGGVAVGVGRLATLVLRLRRAGGRGSSPGRGRSAVTGAVTDEGRVPGIAPSPRR
jgi:hypothetical protein